MSIDCKIYIYNLYLYLLMKYMWCLGMHMFKIIQNYTAKCTCSTKLCFKMVNISEMSRNAHVRQNYASKW